MANESVAKSSTGVPIPYVTAVWTGMNQDDILKGLRDGSILAPPGAPAGWLPSIASGAVNSAATATVVTQADAALTHDKVNAWFAALDSSLDATTFDGIWRNAGVDDSSRGQALTSYLAKTLLGVTAGRPDSTNGAASSAMIRALDAFVADPAHHAKIVDLSAKTGSEIASMAQSDLGYRYALTEMQPFALTGNRALFATQNADGHLDRFDPDSGESLLSDDWLSDRSKLLAWKVANDAGKEMAVAGNENWTFIDRTTTDATGNPLEIHLKSTDTNAGNNQVIFGSDQSEVIKGVAGSDRIYGGDGDDVLRGGAGGDHLEGGAGDDLVMGGAGNDELLGNQGADELDGGAGDDRLTGGSGADNLTGGRGSDRLEGGLGDDTYSLEAGDGHDTIVDADGVGTIELDGAKIRGTMQMADGKWVSVDGRIEFAFNGDAAEGGTLTVKAWDAGASHDGMPDNMIEVKNWKNGDLGITLADGLSSGAAADTPGSLASLTGPEVPFIAPADLVANAGGSESASVSAEPDGTGGADASAAAAEPATASNEAASAIAGSAVGEGAIQAFDFDSAVASLLGSGTPNAATVDPASLQSAINAFSGVLAPPDVTAWASFDSAPVADSVTPAHVADALASNAASDDFAGEMAAMAATSVPDMWQSEATARPSDRFANVRTSSN